MKGSAAKGKQKRGALRRDALIQAAAALFWIKGYSGTSLADVAKTSEVPLGNLYYYYKTKADLALGVANFFVDETTQLIESVSQEKSDPRERLRFLVERMRATQGKRLSYGCPISAACRDFRETAPEASARAGESFALLIAFIAQELAKTGRKPSVALVKARHVIAEWQGGIALAHGLQQPNVLAETYARMERTLTG
jgi:AcrR family transcriptional regulator